MQTYKYCNSIAYNECFTRNSDQAKLILVEDTDETFLQPKLELVDTKENAFKLLSEHKRLETSSDINAFNAELKCDTQTSLSSFLNKFPKEVSIYFPQVMLLKDELAEEIFMKIELVLAQQNEGGNVKFPLKIKIQKNANFAILINDKLEMIYARNLGNIYKHLIKPYLTQNEKLFEKESERMRRFLYMNVIDVRGKSFVNTKTCEHLPGPHGPDESVLTSNSYFVSHFRKTYKLTRTDKSIREFGLDLNYFACYVRPMIEKTKELWNIDIWFRQHNFNINTAHTDIDMLAPGLEFGLWRSSIGWFRP